MAAESSLKMYTRGLISVDTWLRLKASRKKAVKPSLKPLLGIHLLWLSHNLLRCISWLRTLQWSLPSIFLRMNKKVVVEVVTGTWGGRISSYCALVSLFIESDHDSWNSATLDDSTAPKVFNGMIMLRDLTVCGDRSRTCRSQLLAPSFRLFPAVRRSFPVRRASRRTQSLQYWATWAASWCSGWCHPSQQRLGTSFDCVKANAMMVPS